MRRLISVAILCVLGSTIAVGQVIYNNASTAGEGYQRGMASVISAAGEASLNASQARINNQDNPNAISLAVVVWIPVAQRATNSGVLPLVTAVCGQTPPAASELSWACACEPRVSIEIVIVSVVVARKR